MRRFMLYAPFALLACAAPQRANLAYLQYRAVFDLGCPAQSLALYHIDERTKAVNGCGKQLVYIERCDQGAGNTCSWELDSPTFAQGQWTQPPPAPAVAATPAPRQRTIPTELFGGSRATVPQRDANSRAAPTELFPPQPPAATPPPTDGQPF
jgi:hypothetical protein